MTGNLDDILQELKRGLEAIYGPRLKGLYLYGSRARGDAEEDSDIDVAMVLDEFESIFEEMDRYADVRYDVCLAHDCLVHVMPISVSDWTAGRESMIANARDESVPLI